MNIVNLFVSLLLGILGVIIKFSKASWLIAGYNTSSKEEKEKYDETALCKFVGNLLFVLAVIILFIAAAGFLNLRYFTVITIIGWILFVIVTIGAVIYMNTGSRFKRL